MLSNGAWRLELQAYKFIIFIQDCCIKRQLLFSALNTENFYQSMINLLIIGKATSLLEKYTGPRYTFTVNHITPILSNVNTSFGSKIFQNNGPTWRSSTVTTLSVAFRTDIEPSIVSVQLYGNSKPKFWLKMS